MLEKKLGETFDERRMINFVHSIDNVNVNANLKSKKFTSRKIPIYLLQSKGYYNLLIKNKATIFRARRLSYHGLLKEIEMHNGDNSHKIFISPYSKGGKK